MSLLEAILLAIVQGVTEFLPISSSAHLVLVPWWLGWEAPGLAFDTVLHLGTLLAVVLYFWRDWWDLAVGLWPRSARRDPAQQRLLLALIVGTLPAAVVGYLFEDFFAAMFERPVGVAVGLILTGLLLILAERRRHGGLTLERIGWLDAFIVGLAQAVAIFPGISRSGITIAAGLGRGLERPAAARFSFLLSAPIIFGAGLFQLRELIATGFDTTGVLPVVTGLVVAAVAGMLSIRYLLRYLQRRTLYAFTGYVWLLALITLVRAVLVGG
ncbi:MAG: undecaprenyl-diphosphatase UppP [Anaerolineae bacterium]|nr:undecaprenyl-diphosphatase UppP [Caldilineales bacterium]MCX7851763.1 undecaprenyl-diphosphatase UppP [Caldilineales bacterium]MDW8268975.1 undecaprenyl-diphosphatase UppP [Anaerolineae bacterium]